MHINRFGVIKIAISQATLTSSKLTMYTLLVDKNYEKYRYVLLKYLKMIFQNRKGRYQKRKKIYSVILTSVRSYVIL